MLLTNPFNVTSPPLALNSPVEGVRKENAIVDGYSEMFLAIVNNLRVDGESVKGYYNHYFGLFKML